MKLKLLLTLSTCLSILMPGCSDHNKRLAELDKQIEQLEEEIANASTPDDQPFAINNQRESERKKSNIELEGFIYRQKSPRSGDYFRYQHAIELVVKNLSDQDYKFEIISFVQEPINARGGTQYFQARSVKNVKHSGASADHIVDDKWVLSPGVHEYFCIGIRMPVGPLHEQTLDLPILLRIKIQNDRKTIAEYTTALPELDELPELARDHDGKFVGNGNKLDLIETRRFIAPEGSPRIY